MTEVMHSPITIFQGYILLSSWPNFLKIYSRSTAMAVTLVSARMGAIIGNLVFGYLVESHCATPILMVAGLLFGKLS